MAELQDLGWCIIELMGHRRLGGLVREHVFAGAPFVRVDVPSPDGEGFAAMQLYGPSAVFCVTPTTEETARALSKREQPAPVQRWELPALKPKSELQNGDELARDTLDESSRDMLDDDDDVSF